jgi:Abnormal spindle-like microcephaly-assoc'd, ASPM-SPD-2-Hydin
MGHLLLWLSSDGRLFRGSIRTPMSKWNLFLWPNYRQTTGMQIPHCTRWRFFIRFSTMASVALALLPLPVRATATEQLVCSPATLGFGVIDLGQSETELVSLVNNGSSSVTVSSATAVGAEFSVTGIELPATIPAGGFITLGIIFAPTESGWVPGRITFVSNATNRYLQLPLAGAGVKAEMVSANPSAVSFGNVSLKSSSTVPVVLTNQGTSKLTITALDVIGSDFSVSNTTLPASLSHGQSLDFSVTFQPQTTGLIGGSILVAGYAFKIPLSGTGTTAAPGQLSIVPSGLTFGSVDIGSSAAQSSTLTATGGSVTISSASSSNSEFSISAISFPVTLTAGQSADFKVVFSPANAGAASGTVTLNSNASNPSASESVSGTGTAAQYSVTLSWNRSTSSVAGYNVYRGTTAGTYSRLNSAVDSSTSYTDNSVVSGTTYYYAATSVSTNGQESGYSSPIKVSIP